MADQAKAGRPGHLQRIDRTQGLAITDLGTEAIIRGLQVQEATIDPHQE